jgi:hypothetical protein
MLNCKSLGDAGDDAFGVRSVGCKSIHYGAASPFGRAKLIEWFADYDTLDLLIDLTDGQHKTRMAGNGCNSCFTTITFFNAYQ